MEPVIKGSKRGRRKGPDELAEGSKPLSGQFWPFGDGPK